MSILKTTSLPRARALAPVCAAALTLTLAGALVLAQAAPALADLTPTNVKSTNMQLKIDETQITAVIPTEVPIAVMGSGEFETPQNVSITNSSVFSVHVSKVKATVATSPVFTLVSKGQNFTDAAGNDTLWMTVKAGTHELDLSTATGTTGVATQDGDWNMGKATATVGDDTDKLSLTVAGAVKNPTGLKSDTPATALTVQWTLAAGAPTATPAP